MENPNKSFFYSSKKAARQAIKAGSLWINGIKAIDPNVTIESFGLIHDEYIVVRMGKKEFRLVKIIKPESE